MNGRPDAAQNPSVELFRFVERRASGSAKFRAAANASQLGKRLGRASHAPFLTDVLSGFVAQQIIWIGHVVRLRELITSRKKHEVWLGKKNGGSRYYGNYFFLFFKKLRYFL